MNGNKKHNFGGGPCVLPESVLQKAAEAVINWNDLGLSILEVSHRSPEFESVIVKKKLLIRELLHVPDSSQYCSCREEQVPSLAKDKCLNDISKIPMITP